MEVIFFCLQVLCLNLAAILSWKLAVSVNRIVLAQNGCFHKFLNYPGSEQLYLWKINSYQWLLDSVNLIILTNFIHISSSHQSIVNLLMGFKAMSVMILWWHVTVMNMASSQLEWSNSTSFLVAHDSILKKATVGSASQYKSWQKFQTLEWLIRFIIPL